MNLRVGTQRLALLVGAVGAILGGFASYTELQNVMNQSEQHNRFRHLANTDVVKREREQMKVDLSHLTNPTVTDSNGWESGVYPIKSGIKTIHWGHDYGVESIETEDGQTLYPTPAPSAWMFLLVALFPVLGFFIPWGAVRAIGWAGAGFVRPMN
jgi:hypothetical protein